MRLPDSRLAARLTISASLLALLAGCGLGGNSAPLASATAPLASLGPSADYPMVLGEAFTVEGVTYTPADTLNFDRVGYALADEAGGRAISGSHRELPLPSYVEVTSLETGRTILVRLERRGPMQGGEAVQIGLSPGALEQLGAQSGVPVRVRRVVPPEAERALLRAGERAPERIDTPMSLVEVLKRNLPPASPDAASPTALAESGEIAPALALIRRDAPQPLEVVDTQPSSAAAGPAAAEASEPLTPDLPQPQEPEPGIAAAPPAAEPVAGPAAVQSGLVVQAGAFSSRSRAQAVARAIGGTVSPSGSLFRVRTGPFASRAEAEASLAKVQAAGYREARIFNSE